MGGKLGECWPPHAISTTVSRLPAAAGGLPRMGGQDKHLYIHALFGQGWKTREMLIASGYINSREQTARGCGRSAPHGRPGQTCIYTFMPFSGRGGKLEKCWSPHAIATTLSRLPAAAGGLPRVGGRGKHLYIHAFFGQGWKTREMLVASC